MYERTFPAFLLCNPDYVSPNGTFDIVGTYRASLGDFNASFYAKIDWDNFQDHYQRQIEYTLKSEPEKFTRLKEAAAVIGPALREGAAKAKIFEPGEIGADLEALRKFSLE